MKLPPLKAPFIWFGGKRRVAGTVWAALGDVHHYVEPFAGSLAVLLGRPQTHRHTVESVNDVDGYICNFWRAVARDPDAVAHYADWPVNELDILARHKWLVTRGTERLQSLKTDPMFFDARVAGWWVWGINCWIGSGWCQPKSAEASQSKLPSMTNRGVHKYLPKMGSGRGIHKKLPQMGSNQGVRRRPAVSAPLDGGLVNSREGDIRYYFRTLSRRMREVRVACGDWSRVVTDGVLSAGSTVGVFFDPPYNGFEDAYASPGGDNPTPISTAVRQWCVTHGDNPKLRIALCGYNDEHASEMPKSWRVFAWSASACYQSAESKDNDGGGNARRHNERIWFSPHCRHPEQGLGLGDCT